MKIGFIIFDGMEARDFLAVYDPLARLKSLRADLALDLELCAQSAEVEAENGLKFVPTRTGQPLAGFDWLIVPGSSGITANGASQPLIAWLQTCPAACRKSAVADGRWLWQAAFPDHDLTLDQRLITAAQGLQLGLDIVEEIAGHQTRMEVETALGTSPAAASTPPTSAPVSFTGRSRTAHITRKTRETNIEIRLNLDGSGRHQISTGLGFFDHMLTHLAVHGLFDLTVAAEGDLHIDPHHTVEDVALALGQAFAQALGDRAGIVRAASFTMPMDETLAFVAVDFSGRPFAAIQADWHSPAVGSLPTTLLPHFFQSFAFTARCNLHARILAGSDDHHQAEALFKALARALGAATRLEPRLVGVIPSTKGTLVA